MSFDLAVRTCVPGPRRVSVVLPCLNEEHAVGRCVDEARTALDAAGYVGEVIVVDNNSTDDSALVARRSGARVIRERHPGYGSALRAGFRAARGDYIVMADADATYPIDALRELVEPVANGEVDIMVGARLDAATSASMPFTHRYIGTPALTTLVRLASGGNDLSDSQSGFRAFRTSTVQELGLASSGMELASEMLVRANQQGLRLGEVPLGYRARLGSSKLNTWRDGMRHLRLILRLGPHVALWYPGLVALGVSIGLLVASLFAPDGIVVGEILWQPVFAASILAVVGVCAATAGATLAAIGPDTSPLVREQFRWVAAPVTGRRVRLTAFAAIAIGILTNAGLFVRWAVGRPVLHAQLQIAALAQVLIIVGAILLMVAALHRLLPARGERAAL
jgi:hypothetical protein